MSADAPAPLAGAAGSACPACGSSHVAGMVNPFWVALNADGSPVQALHELVESETEIGDYRMCLLCDARWQDGSLNTKGQP